MVDFSVAANIDDKGVDAFVKWDTHKASELPVLCYECAHLTLEDDGLQLMAVVGCKYRDYVMRPEGARTVNWRSLNPNVWYTRKSIGIAKRRPKRRKAPVANQT